MTKRLKISAQLSLPLDTETSTGIVYGGKGMGKTNFGAVLAEECHKVGIHFAVVDPMGVWWGLRHSPNGKGPGIEVLILGGIHGDIPIEPTGGAVVADLVVDERANVIVDISRRPDGTMWSIADRVRFVRDYCKRLYQRQGEKRRPVLQFIDEAARFVPQVIRKDDSDVAACMGAIAVLVEEGRNVGIGVILITQRSARLNKDVAELADCMIAFRTVGPNSRRAVLDWLGEHVEKEKIKTYDQQIRALPRGTALVVSPGWLEYEGFVAIRMRETFDSSATPKRGRQRRVTGGAKPDLAKYRQLMAATIEKAQAEDPKLLKRRIDQLQRELAGRAFGMSRKTPPAKTVEKTVTKTVKVPAITAIQIAQIRRAAETFERGGKQAAAAATAMMARLDKVVSSLQPPIPRIGKPQPFVVTNEAVQAAIKKQRPTINQAFKKEIDRQIFGDAQLKLGARRMATVLATWYPRPLTKTQLASLSNIVPGSGTFYNYLRSLVSCSLVTSAVTDELVRINPSVVDSWRNGSTPASASEIAAQYAGSLKAGARRMLDVLIELGPDGTIDKTALANHIGIAPGSGTFYNYLRSLVRNDLAADKGKDVVPGMTLFLAEGDA